MSDCLMPYLVPADDIRSVFGSNDRELVRDMIAEFPTRIRSLEEWAAGYYEDQSDEREVERLTVAQAVENIVRGDLGDSDPLHYNLYLGVWELVCSYLGRRLPEHWSVRWSWIEPFDQWLGRAGLPVRVGDLIYSTPPPFPLPKNPDTGMSVGHWPAEDISRSRLLLARADLRPEDDEQADTVDALRRWFEAACEVRNPMIVGFCY